MVRLARILSALPLLLAQPAAAGEWRLVWSDEFDKPTIDPAKWSFETDCWGGGNDERQCYTRSKRNAAIVDGQLRITARHERATGSPVPQTRRPAEPTAEVTREFTSARLITRGKGAWRYGRIEVRARLPQGQGAWPAIWMLPEDDSYGRWAASGEIDILEAVNLGVPCAACPSGREDTILGTLHFGGAWPNNALSSTEIHAPEVLDGFHTYGIEWDADKITWQIDGRTYAQRKSSEWWSAGSQSPGAPFNREFHLILNLAIGGKLAEGRGIGGVAQGGFPKRFAIDWVRVWQNDHKPAIAATERSIGKGH